MTFPTNTRRLHVYAARTGISRQLPGYGNYVIELGYKLNITPQLNLGSHDNRPNIHISPTLTKSNKVPN